MNKILAVIVTYNRKKLLEESIEALLNQSYKEFDILIVDNNSSDGTYEDVVKKYLNNQVKYINTNKNIGGAGGFNVGIKEAIESGYEFALLMDDDTIVTQNTLDSLVNKANILDNKFSFLSSLCKWIDGNLANMNKQVINERLLDYYEKMDNRLVALERASFVSLYLNLKIAKKVGLPYKEFFIYGDDWEYCLRLGKEYPGYLDLDSKVIHKMKENVSANIFYVEKDRIDRNYFNYRNLSFTYRKFSKKKWIKFLIRNFIDFIKIPFVSKNNRVKRMIVLLKGNIAGIFFNPKIEYINQK